MTAEGHEQTQQEAYRALVVKKWDAKMELKDASHIHRSRKVGGTPSLNARERENLLAKGRRRLVKAQSAFAASERALEAHRFQN